MSKTIEELQSYLEELEKRIKAMSKAHTTLELLIEITSYFDTVQHYLNDIEDSFDSHTTSCEEYATQIASLQEQISTINDKLQNSSGNGSFDTTEINTKLENLTTNLTTLETKLNSFMGENATSLDSLVEDISSVQTEVGSLQEQIDAITTEISSINESIGSMQTTITNLNSTQNSLSSAQNSMSANINSIDSRLTTAENNISVLTGGIDVGEFDERITTLEDANGFSNHYAYKKAIYNLTPSDFKLFTPEYYFCSTTNGYTELKLNLSFENVNSTTMQIEFYANKNLIDTFNVDLTKHINNYEIIYKYKATMNGQSLKLKCTADSSIKYSNLEMELHGANVHFFDYDKNVKVHCFDNQAFITKIENGIAYYGEFASTDTIDLNNLPNQKAFQGENDSYIFIEYVPYTTGNLSDGYTDYVYALVTETAENKRNITILNENNNTSDKLKNTTIPAIAYTAYNWACCMYPHTYAINPTNQQIAGYRVTGSGAYDYLIYDENVVDKWVFVNPIASNENTYGTKIRDAMHNKIVAINLNGNAYFIPKRNPTYFVKVGKGLFATGFEHGDTSINIYVSDYNKTDKYKLTLNTSNKYESSFVETITDCDCIYETYNNTIIKHIVSTNSWETATLEY